MLSTSALRASRLLAAFAALTGLSALAVIPAAAQAKDAKTFLKVGIIKKKDGACEQSEIVAFDPVVVKNGTYTKTLDDFERSVYARCPVGTGKPCNLPVKGMVEEGKGVAVLVETIKQEHNCRSTIIAYFKSNTSENAMKSVAEHAVEWQWSGYRVIRQWPPPVTALVEEAVEKDAAKKPATSGAPPRPSSSAPVKGRADADRKPAPRTP